MRRRAAGWLYVSAMHARYPFSPQYRPLSWRFALAAIGVVLSVVLHGLFMVVSASMAEDMQQGALDLSGALVVLVTSLASLGSFALAVTGVCVWVYGAAANLRAFGQQGMKFSPGWAVGWWFVPFVNLVRPVQIVTELWRASDPASIEIDNPFKWWSARANGLVAIWWTTYLVSGVMSQIHVRAHDLDVKLAGAVGSGVSLAVAGLTLIALMWQIGKRQEHCADRARANVVPTTLPTGWAPHFAA